MRPSVGTGIIYRVAETGTAVPSVATTADGTPGNSAEPVIRARHKIPGAATGSMTPADGLRAKPSSAKQAYSPMVFSTASSRALQRMQ